MAQLVADSDGKISGRFTVPPNIPVGTKLMQFVGSEGNYGEASYTARGIITTEERRRVTTLTDIRQQQTTVVVRRFRSDPLAQTFTLNQGRHIGGVDLWFTEKGTRRVIAQIRETTTGIPNQTILAEAHAQAEDINLSGGHTRIEWAPVWLDAGTEYAIVILTDDAEPAVRVAELGKYDAVHERWVTSQPYQVGVLLSSSNASTWTPHQDRDLTFRLLGARFTATTRTIDLGNITVSDVSDVIALANIERPATDTDVEIVLTDEQGKEIRIADDRPLALRDRLNGDVNVKAVLRGSDLRSPVMFPGLQAILGNMSESANYITRALPAGVNSKVTVTYESLLPGLANVAVDVQDTNGDWHNIPLSSGSPVGDDWEERTHILENFTADETRVRITITGNPLYRPRLRALRVIIT